MLTPKDLQEIKFDKVMFGGYDMGAVDSFLTDVENDYAQLYKENTTLKKSMKVLVAKIEEYRGMDDSMRKALSSAQVMASQIVEKANADAQRIESEAKARSEEQLRSYSGRIAAEEMKLEEAKTSVQMFIERMLALYSQASAELQSVNDTELNVDEIEEPVIPAYIQAVAAQPIEKAPEPVSEPEPEPAAEPEPEPVMETIILPTPEPSPAAEPEIFEEPAAEEPEGFEEPAAEEPVIEEKAEGPVEEPENLFDEPEEKTVEEPEAEDLFKEIREEIPATEYVEPAPVVENKPELDFSIFEKPEEKPEFDFGKFEDTVEKPAEPAADFTVPEKTFQKPEIDLSIFDEPKKPAEAPVKPAHAVIPDTVQLPYIPAVPQTTAHTPKPQAAVKPQAPQQSARELYKQGITSNSEFPNSVKRARSGDDDGETIILTPKPRFDFSDLQFGDNYEKKDK